MMKINVTFAYLPAYTLQDILDILPKCISDGNYVYYLNLAVSTEGCWCISYDNYDIGGTLEYIDSETPIDTVYKLLLWAIENGYVETNKEQ